jgi:hypothetical protein
MAANLLYCNCASITNSVVFWNTGSVNGDWCFQSGNSLINCLGFNKVNYDRNNLTAGGALATDCAYYYNKWMFKDEGFYELTDEAKAAITGTDGTEVGMYGGNSPYNPIPDGSRITKFTVAGKSDTENKLNVEVQVSNGE